MTDPVSTDEKRPPRTLSREARRSQLIEATIETLAERGYSRTTLTEVARKAGLSHGLVLFHFETKAKLLADTLDYLSDEYRENWQSALERAGPRPEDQLAALIRADFNPAICTPGRLAAWCSFWGESQNRPIYQARCGSNDDHYNDTLERICAQMNAEHGYSHNPARAGRLIRVTVEGVWLDLMTMADPYDAAEALRTVWTGAGALYPRHFTPEGPETAVF